MLEVSGLSAWYGQAQALRDVAFEVKEGELITLVGRNGAGKTTTLRCVMGLHRLMTGTVRLGGRDLAERILTMRPDIKVLFMSGHTQDVILKEGVKAGTPFLQKPFAPADLAHKVREVLDSQDRFQRSAHA